MSERVLSAIAAALLALVLGLAFFWQPALPERPLPRAGQPDGGDFTVQTVSGPLALHDFKGKLVLLYFGYTFCPDICPTSLSATAAGLKLLSADERARVAVIFISVDPERDTLPHLKEYAAFFDPQIIGATDTPARIAEIARRYGVFYVAQKTAQAGGSYVVDHSADTLVVDEGGRLVGKIVHGSEPEKIVATIRKYLKPL